VPTYLENGTSLLISRYTVVDLRIQNLSSLLTLFSVHQGNGYIRLQTIDDIERLRNTRVPHGIYVSSQGSYQRADSFPCEPDDDDDSVYSNHRSLLSGHPGSSHSPVMMVPAKAYKRGTQVMSTSLQSPLSGNLPRLFSVVGHAPSLPARLQGSPRTLIMRHVGGSFQK
jgi:hypothetical protein